ncbi:MAG: hypothetical protein MZU97_11840 [Bacillus subtilis]|nr:hypothetical protein [Bacillus subtilis]
MKKILLCPVDPRVHRRPRGLRLLRRPHDDRRARMSHETPRSIATVDEFVAMNTTDHYVLGADIDLGGVEWIPLGTPARSVLRRFRRRPAIPISELHRHGQAYGGFLGLFGSVTGDLANLTVTDFTIDATSTKLIYAGGLAGLYDRVDRRLRRARRRSFDPFDRLDRLRRSSCRLRGLVHDVDDDPHRVRRLEITNACAAGTIDVERQALPLRRRPCSARPTTSSIADSHADAAIAAQRNSTASTPAGSSATATAASSKAHADMRRGRPSSRRSAAIADASITITTSGTKAAVGRTVRLPPGRRSRRPLRQRGARRSAEPAIDVGGLVGRTRGTARWKPPSPAVGRDDPRRLA